MSDPREEIILRGLQAASTGDREGALEAVDPGIEIRTDTQDGVPTYYHGVEGWREWSDSWNEVWEDVTYEPGEIERHGDDFLVAVTTRARGRGSGIELSQELMWVFTIPEGGRATRIHLYRDRELALAAIRA